MRKILLATTALVGVALSGAAHAAESPIAVNVGGYVDFRAAQFSESHKAVANQRHSDFENTFQVDIEASAKATNGVEYGAKVGLWNGNADDAAAGQTVSEHDAYVWLSGVWGKVVFGDALGASTEMFVGAPTVGEGQIDGTYYHFTDTTKLFSTIVPSYMDDDENSTKITYYTPKVGNENHKVQLGVSFTPNYGDKGEAVVLTKGTNYKNVISSALEYTGKFSPVTLTVSAVVNDGTADKGVGSTLRDFTTYGGGVQAAYAGFTVGGSYVDAGHFNTDKGGAQQKPQDAWTAGVKYEFNKVALAVNILDGRGYNNFGTAAAPDDHYVRDIQELGLGATYNWFPGLTTAADAVFFKQKVQDKAIENNQGHVLMLSQKLAF
ncbi:MAG: porin [Alphaproteobacteria bacterium]|nr:porin [Alphaproteobacteria bacterium]